MADSEATERAIVGALRSAIHDHGPITPERIASAAKRVAGNLQNVAAEKPRRACRGRPALGHQGHGVVDQRACQSCRMRRARERLGLTQVELAATLSASHRSVQRWEREPASVDPRALKLAELLGRK